MCPYLTPNIVQPFTLNNRIASYPVGSIPFTGSFTQYAYRLSYCFSVLPIWMTFGSSALTKRMVVGS